MHRPSLVLDSAAVALPGISAGSPLVISSEGSLPLLLTAPHDGDEPIGSVPVRVSGSKLRDVGTRALAEKVASLLDKRLNAGPRMVIAKFSRKFLDANRPEQKAMESVEALPTYQAYHGEIARHIAALRSVFPQGALLLDIHGQSLDPHTTFRNTCDGLSVKSLLERHGIEAVQGENSILGGLAARGYNVNPRVSSPSLEEYLRFAGGHTYRFYGSHQPHGIDAMQLEFGWEHRANPRLADDLAEAIVTFLSHYGGMA